MLAPALPIAAPLGEAPTLPSPAAVASVEDLLPPTLASLSPDATTAVIYWEPGPGAHSSPLLHMHRVESHEMKITGYPTSGNQGRDQAGPHLPGQVGQAGQAFRGVAVAWQLLARSTSLL